MLIIYGITINEATDDWWNGFQVAFFWLATQVQALGKVKAKISIWALLPTPK